MRSSLIVLAAIAAFTVTAAGDINNDTINDTRPPWWRYKDGGPVVNRSTYQRWGFDDASTGAEVLGLEPDDYVNSLYNPLDPENPPLSALITSVEAWKAGEDGRDGVWSLSGGGGILFEIPNYPSDPGDDPEKKVRIQLAWKRVDPGANNFPSFFGFAQGEFLTQATTEWMDTPPLTEGEDWFHTVVLLMFRPNPAHEQLMISGDIMVDEVIIDTICPEPGTLLVLSVGIPFVLKLKRRGGN